MFIFSTVLRIFLGKNCLSLIQSVEIVNMVSYSILYGKGILWNHHCLLGTYVRGLPLPTNYHPHERLYKHCLIFIFEIWNSFRNLISQIFKAFFCWVFMHKHTQDNKILYVFFYATHFLQAVESLWATIF